VERFLIVAPAGRDAEVIRQLLSTAGIDAVADGNGELLFEALRDGLAAGAVLTDDALLRLNGPRLS
jgi:hypothetical protein